MCIRDSTYSGAGAISAREGSRLVLRGSLIFSKNTSNGGAQAGAIFLSGQSKLSISQKVIFTENIGEVAGAIFSNESEIVLGKSTFLKNRNSEGEEDRTIYLIDTKKTIEAPQAVENLIFDENEE